MDTGGNSLPSPSCADDKKRRVSYYYDPGIAHVKFSDDHVMVPARVAMAHSLVGAHGMLGDMRRLRTRPATEAEIRRFHSSEYVGLLRELTPEGYADDGPLQKKARRHGVGDDCPAFDRLWEYCRSYAGGSLAAARALVGGDSDIAINWSGGMHHACQDMASGFCYVNDIVLAVNELLGRFQRVIYVDIDAHHGDGVEKAFAESNRVMTLSFHRYGIRNGQAFFPGTGAVGDGDSYRVNVPLDYGVRDEGYHAMFKPIVTKAMEVFRPEAIVLQCGADSLSGDRLGGMELSTAVALGKERELPDEIPRHGYEDFYLNQGYKLHYKIPPAPAKKKCRNAAPGTMQQVLERLSGLELAPSVQFHERRSSSAAAAGDDLYYEHPPSLEDEDSAQRLHRLIMDKSRARTLDGTPDP
uniref:Histone deacetylase n=1 Tax=Oryza brachyantha TaxID=4533 RepID=J3N6N8_ORYBR